MSFSFLSGAVLLSDDPAGGGVYEATGCTASLAEGSNGCLQTFVPGAVAHRPTISSKFHRAIARIKFQDLSFIGHLW